MKTEEQRKLETNIWKVKLNFFLTNFFIYSSILFVSFQDKGFSYSGIALILFVATAVGLVFNVPTGIIADRWGRKYVLMIAGISGIISMFLWSSSVYLIVVIGMVFRSLVDACIQGTDTALLYDTLKDLKREEEYTKHNANRFTMAMLGFAFAAILASIIPKYGEYLYHFWLTSIAFFGAFLISWSLYEPKHHRNTSKTSLAHLTHAFHVTRTHKELRKIVTYTFIISGCLIILTYFQFFMREAGIPVQSFGLIYAGLAFLSAAASHFAFSIERKIGEKAMLLLMPALFITGSLFFIFGNTPIAIIAGLIAIEIFLGTQGAVLNTYMQRHVESAYRSTVDSLTGFYGAAYRAIMYLCMGVLADIWSIRASIVLLLAMSLFLIIPPLWLLVKANKAQHVA